MAKMDFNVPLLDENREPVTQFKIDLEKTKVDDQGRVTQAVVADADGKPVKESVMLNKLLAQLVNSVFADEKELGHEERVKRGKLVRKLSDTSKGSLKNYSSDEIQIIKKLLVKGQATPLLAIQFEEIAEGTEGEESPVDQPAAA
jgi:hypothetical protein